ncbi:unnamed protein product [Orchesella dallaii]|uniref:Peptidase A2B Ty3 transposon peptidase domain-containing protein n=1 Tax=Orchesella dallaii TaxID=48710 RepID=A0ABP1R7W3_9HEXA
MMELILDSGSSVSLLREDVAHGLHFEKNTPPLRIAGVDKKPLAIHFHITTPVGIQSITLSCKFYILPEAPFQALLGNDNMREQGVVIDFNTQNAKIGKQTSVPFIHTVTTLLTTLESGLEYKPLAVIATETVTFPINSNQTIPVVFPEIVKPTLFYCPLTPKYGLIVTGIHISTSKPSCTFLKLSNKPVTIYEQQEVLLSKPETVNFLEISCAPTYHITEEPAPKSVNTELSQWEREQILQLLHEFSHIFLIMKYHQFN